MSYLLCTDIAFIDGFFVIYQRKQRMSLTKVDNSGGKSVAFNVREEEEEDIIIFDEDDDDVKRKVS